MNYTFKLYRGEIRHVHAGLAYGAGPDHISVTQLNPDGTDKFLRFYVVGENAYDRIEVLNANGIKIDELDKPPALPPETKQQIAEATKEATAGLRREPIPMHEPGKNARARGNKPTNGGITNPGKLS